MINYRKIQLDKLKNVEVITDLRLDAQGAREYGAEIVVFATGSHWRGDGLGPATHIPLGADESLPHCLTPEQIMLEGKETGGRVLVYDTEGYFMGASLAEKLARDGKQVTIVTSFTELGPYLFYTGEGVYLNHLLRDLGVEVLPSHVLTRIDAGVVTGHHHFGPGQSVEWNVDSVVLVTQRVSTDGLYRELKAEPDALEREGITGLHRVGDCKAPRIAAEAIFDGHRLAREIDSDNPDEPLPYIREARMLGATDGDYEAALQMPTPTR